MGKELNDDFRALVEREIASLGFTPAGWSGTQLRYRAPGSDKVLEVGTGNLRKRVKLNKPADAAGLVRDFLKNITTVTGPDWKIPDTLEECADRLLPRVGKPFAGDIKAPWSRPIPGTDGLVLNLVIDFPTTMAYVTTDMVEKSSTPADEWVARALANLTAATPADWLKPLRPDDGIFCCHTTDSYDAARALLLCELTGNDPAGWLVAIPARDWLFARKVEMSGLAKFHLLKIMAEKAKKEQPYPISDQVFWVRPGGRWEVFKVEIAGQDVKVSPSPDFIAALSGGDEKSENPPADETNNG